MVFGAVLFSCCSVFLSQSRILPLSRDFFSLFHREISIGIKCLLTLHGTVLVLVTFATQQILRFTPPFLTMNKINTLVLKWISGDNCKCKIIKVLILFLTFSCDFSNSVSHETV